MRHSHSFRRNVLSSAGATVIGSAAQLLLITLLARLLRVEDFAVYVIVAAVVAIGEIGSDFGMRILVVRSFATAPSASNALGSILLTKVFFSFCMGLIVVVLPIHLLHGVLPLLCILIAISQPSTDPFLWYLSGSERQDIEAKIVVLWRLLSVALMILSGLIGGGVELLLVAWLCANLLRLLLESRLVRMAPLMAGGLTFGGFPELRKLVRRSIPIGVSFILIAFYNRLGIFFIEKLGDSSQVAAYGLAFTLVASSGFIGVSITTSSFPSMVRALDQQDYHKASNVIGRALGLISLLYFLGCVAGILTAPWVLSSLYGEKFSMAAGVMILLFPGLYISAVNFELKYAMNALGLNWLDTMAVLLAILGLCVTTLLPLAVRTEQLVAIGWSVGEVVSFLFKWYQFYRLGRLQHIGFGRFFILFLVLVLLIALLVLDK